MWLNYLDPKYRDRAPRIVINKHGKETLQIEPGRILSMPEKSSGIGVSGAFGARDSKERVSRKGISTHARAVSIRTRASPTWTPRESTPPSCIPL